MSTWEERMSARAAEREARKPPESKPEPSSPHAGHHSHVVGSAIQCSCGVVFGVFSFVPDPRYWSDDPAEVEAAQREGQAYLDSISCSVCGERGVVAEKDWGK